MNKAFFKRQVWIRLELMTKGYIVINDMARTLNIHKHTARNDMAIYQIRNPHEVRHNKVLHRYEWIVKIKG